MDASNDQGFLELNSARLLQAKPLRFLVFKLQSAEHSLHVLVGGAARDYNGLSEVRQEHGAGASPGGPQRCLAAGRREYQLITVDQQSCQ